MTSAPSDKPSKPEPRKPYSPPALCVYGDLTRITEVVGMTGANDGGGPKADNKTRI
jgi:hypothetical protein